MNIFRQDSKMVKSFTDRFDNKFLYPRKILMTFFSHRTLFKIYSFVFLFLCLFLFFIFFKKRSPLDCLRGQKRSCAPILIIGSACSGSLQNLRPCQRLLHHQLWTYFTEVKTSVWALTETMDTTIKCRHCSLV